MCYIATKLRVPFYRGFAVLKLLFSVFLTSMMNLELSAQSFLTAKVLDEAGNPLQGASISIDKEAPSTATGKDGRFTLELEPKQYDVTVSFSSYHVKRIQATVRQDTTVLSDISLAPLAMELDQITVKGQLADRQAEESLNIQVVDADFIKRNLGGSLMKSLERIPGINNIGIGSGASKPLIRGLGFNQVLVVENGIKHEGQQWGADHGLEVDQFAVGRMEIIKGPASFMYGPDAIAGVIDIKPPPIPSESSFGGAIDLTGKSNNRLYGTSLNLFGRKNGWFFDTRVTYMDYADLKVPADTVYVYDFAVRLHDRQVRNTAGKEFNLHGSLGYIGEKTTNILSFSRVYNQAGFFANAHGLEPRRVDSGIHDASDRDVLLPNQDVSHTKVTNSAQYKSERSLTELKLGFQNNYRREWSQYVNHGYMPPIYPNDISPAPELERLYDKNVFSFMLKNELFLDGHTLTTGLNGELQHNGIGGWGFLIPAFRQANIGVFAYDKFQLNEEWLLHGALRFDYGRIHIREYRDWFVTEAVQDSPTEQQHLLRAPEMLRTFNSLVWSTGANYTSGDFRLRANAGTSFRMPIAKELAANGVNYHYFRYEKGNPDLSPERSYQLDIGAGWGSSRWSLEASPFFNYFPNFIYLNPTSLYDHLYGAGNQVFSYDQSSVMRLGGEFQARYMFSERLSAEILGEYVYSEQLTGDKKGFTLPFSPPPSALINISYGPERFGILQGPYLSIDFRITGSQNRIVPPERKTPGYQVWNMSAGTDLELGKQAVTVNLQVQNLFNTRYLNHTSFYRLIELPEMGRNIILSLKVPFSLKKQ